MLPNGSTDSSFRDGSLVGPVLSYDRSRLPRRLPRVQSIVHGTGDRILCVGNPENDWFAVSYGKVTSGFETFGELKGLPSNGMKHSAYMHVGSSSGAAINEQMELAGITPGGSYSLDGKTFNYGVLIPVSELRQCLNDWSGAKAESSVKTGIIRAISDKADGSAEMDYTVFEHAAAIRCAAITRYMISH